MSAHQISRPDITGQSSEMIAAATEIVDAVTVAAADCIGRSAVVCRLSEGSLPFSGRIAWLEQHWEGLRILHDYSAGPGAFPAAVRHELTTDTQNLSSVLDRAHASARWRDRHVTMPSMLAFRRHVAGLRDSGDVLGMVAQAYIRVLCTRIASGIAQSDDLSPHYHELREFLFSLVNSDEDVERLSEELSAGLWIFMQHGSDVCRTYHEARMDESCAVTAATIRNTLR